VELTHWLWGAHEEGPGAAAPLVHQWSAVGAQLRSQPGETTSIPQPQWRKPAAGISAPGGIRQQVLKKQPRVCRALHTQDLGVVENHDLVVCKGEGAAFPSRPPPTQSPFRLCSPSLPSPVTPLYICSANPEQSWLVSAVTPQVLQHNGSFWGEVEDRKEREIPNLWPGMQAEAVSYTVPSLLPRRSCG